MISKQQIVREINTCIAHNGVDGVEVPLWECPCRECTRIEWEAECDYEHTRSLRVHRQEKWPEFWGRLDSPAVEQGLT